MTGTSRRPVISVLAVVLLVAASGAAGAATISGTARDSTGAPMPGVTVTVPLAATGAERTAVTDADADIGSTGCPPGVMRSTRHWPDSGPSAKASTWWAPAWRLTSRCASNFRSRSW
jgi:hypothetical protein